MIEALLSFLGGTAFRMIWGEISSYLTRRQEHQAEMERMKLQNELDASAHLRQMQGIKIQADLGIKTIRVAAQAEIDKTEALGWLEGVKATAIRTGVAWVDAWNATIRPGVATWAVLMMTLDTFGAIKLTDLAASVSAAALGLYLADRTLAKRGK